jgi:hypothetical protein
LRLKSNFVAIMLAPTSALLLGIRSPLLCHVLKANGIPIAVKKGAFLFKRGGAPSVFLLEKGAMLLVGPSVNDVQFLSKNTVLGVSECLSSATWDFSCFALNPVLVYRIAHKDLVRHLVGRPDLRNQCLAGLAQKAPNFE